MHLEVIDKLFLELSQFSTAKTARELELESTLKIAIMAWNEDGVTEKNSPLWNRLALRAGVLRTEATS